MGRMYVAPLDDLAVTADATQDIWELVNSANKKVILHGFSLTSSYTTDERVRLKLMRRTTTGSAGGSAITPNEVDGGNTLASTVTTFTPLVTTLGTGGDILKCWRWSQQNELLYLPTPEMRPVVPESGRIVLTLATAPGGTRQWDGWVVWEEL